MLHRTGYCSSSRSCGESHGVFNARKPKGRPVRRGKGRKGRLQPNPLRSDPSRTASLRQRFSVELGRRFKTLARDIRRLVETEDAFGLKKRDHNPFDADQVRLRQDTNLIPGLRTNIRGEGGRIVGGSPTEPRLTLNDRWRLFTNPEKAAAFD